MPNDHAARRIACLQPSVTVTLHAIGALDRIVACTRYCADVVPALAGSDCAILADSWTANAEQIVAARPDLVIASVPYQEKAVGEILRAGIRFLGLAPKALVDVYADIATIAGVVGRNEAGELVIASMQERIEKIRQLSAAHPRPKVFCEEWGKPVIASQKWVAELVEAAGGEFVGEPGRPVPEAELKRFDPEIMVASWCGAGDRVPLEKIVETRGWRHTAAAQSGRVFCIRDEYLNTPAVTLLSGLDALAFAIHPELFGKPAGIRQINAVPASVSVNPSR